MRSITPFRPSGVPPHVAAGLNKDGVFRALFADPSDRGIADYFARPDSAETAPGPYFDPDYYKQRNPDWVRRGHPLIHYLDRHMRGDERPAHPFFDAAEYGALNPDVAAAGAATLVHFARHGDPEGRSPSLRFDARFYSRAYLELETPRPLQHYLIKGRRAGHLPVPKVRPRDGLAEWLHDACSGRQRPVLLVSHDARRAGSPILLLALARELVRRGWSPVTLLMEGGELAEAFDALGPCLNLAEGCEPAGLMDAPKNLPAIVNTSTAAALAASLASDQRPVLLLIQEMVDYAIRTGTIASVAAAANAGASLLFLSESIQAGYRAALPDVPHARLHNAMQGVIPPQISCASRLHRIRALRRPEGPLIIGAGYADHRKGFDLFLETAALIAHERPDARFIWLGALSGWASTLAENARRKGLALMLPGFVEDAASWYAASDVFLLSSRQDPGPAVLADAVWQGTPFVGFEADLGIIEIARPFGQFVPENDVRAARDAVLAALATETRASRRDRRKQLRKWASFTRWVDQVEGLL